MVAETSAVGGGAGKRVRKNVAELLADLLRLADLQSQLLTVDVREFWRKAKISIFALVVGGIGLLATLPVALMGLGAFLGRLVNLSLETSLLIVSACAILLAALVLWWSLRRLGGATRTLQRSQKEFEENLAWFRSILHHDEDAHAGGR